MDGYLQWLQHRTKLLEDEIFFHKDLNGKYIQIAGTMRRDPAYFSTFHGMSIDQFDQLAIFIRTDIRLYTALLPELCLSLALRYLATTNYDESYPLTYDLNKSAHLIVVFEVIKIITRFLKPKFLADLTDENLAQMAHDFNTRWKFPNCVGAVDNRLIIIEEKHDEQVGVHECPFAFICDANFRFIHAPQPLEVHESQVRGWNTFPVVGMMRNINENNYPQFNPKFKSVILATGSFPLKENVMRKFTVHTDVTKERLFNLRHTRAHSVVEYALGMLLHRWKIFSMKLICHRNAVADILECAVLLHNWLINDELNMNDRQRSKTPKNVLFLKDESGHFQEELWQTRSTSIGVLRSTHTCWGLSTPRGFSLREKFAEYFLYDDCIV